MLTGFNVCIHLSVYVLCIYVLKAIEILTANTTLNAKRMYFTKLMPHERILNFIWFLNYLLKKKNQKFYALEFCFPCLLKYDFLFKKLLFV